MDRIMQVISVFILIVFVLVGFIFIIKAMYSCLFSRQKETKITQEQKHLKSAKIIYFICSIPIMFSIFYCGEEIISYLKYPMSHYTFEGMLLDFIAMALLYMFLILNYSFIDKAYNRKMADKKIVLFFSCLSGLSCFLFLLPNSLAVVGFPFLIISLIANIFIISDNKNKA